MAGQRRAIDIGVLSTRELIQKSLTDFTREDLYIALPAVVVSIDDYESLQCVDVRGLINDVYEDEAIIEAVLIKKVFVKLPSGGDVSICLPIKVGDLVTLHWAHRNLSTFLDNAGQSVDEPIDMVADIRDCWVEHGFGTRSNNQRPSKSNYIFRHKNTTLTVTPEGKYTLETNADVDIITPAKVNIKCAKAYIDAPETEFTGNVKIGGTLEVEGMSSLKGGTKSPSYGSLTGSGGTMTIGNVVVESSVTINGIAVEGHTHNGQVPPFA